MTASAATTGTSRLPAWSSVLAVVAHPDDESFGLGAVLDTFGQTGATVSVLCLTKGEASTLQQVAGDLATLRAAELHAAARALGVDSAVLRDHPDGALERVDVATLMADVLAAVKESTPDGLVVFDPSGVSGHPDHAAATRAALAAADCLHLPVLGWTVPRAVADRLNQEFDTTFSGHEAGAIDLTVAVDRKQQRIASLAHASQAIPTSILWRRLALSGDVESLRWLRREDTAAPHLAVRRAEDGDAPAAIRVQHRGGDRFDVAIRGHRLTVDQPVEVGGEDLGPTPTELFVAGLASCVAFYVRRYLHRHKLESAGLAVETAYRLGSSPARVAGIDIRIELADDLPAARREGLLAVARHCTVHNSITIAPQISVSLSEPASAGERAREHLPREG